LTYIFLKKDYCTDHVHPRCNSTAKYSIKFQNASIPKIYTTRKTRLSTSTLKITCTKGALPQKWFLEAGKNIFLGVDGYPPLLLAARNNYLGNAPALENPFLRRVTPSAAQRNRFVEAGVGHGMTCTTNKLS
jgi:hypothetical protein